MSIYLGQLGRLVELKCPASQQVTPEDRYSFQQTAEGKSKAQVRPSLGPRTWALGTSDATTPQDQGAILSFVNGEWGPGPFVFVPVDAPVTNMLTPQQAACDPLLVVAPGVAAGPLFTPDGWAGRSYSNPNPADLLWFGAQPTPVIGNTSVTASVYLLGSGARARLYFYDSAGSAISTHLSTVAATAGTVVRSWVTAPVPSGAVSCRVLAFSATAGARPAITWTDTLLPWADGQGCQKAVLHGASRNLIMASRDPRGGRYSNISYTATEVG